MLEIWKHHFLDHGRRGHLRSILSLQDNKFKSPKPVRGKSKLPTHCSLAWIAQEAEIIREKLIIHVLGRVS
jgi:hypothetical protein